MLFEPVCVLVVSAMACTIPPVVEVAGIVLMPLDCERATSVRMDSTTPPVMLSSSSSEISPSAPGEALERFHSHLIACGLDLCQQLLRALHTLELFSKIRVLGQIFLRIPVLLPL